MNGIEEIRSPIFSRPDNSTIDVVITRGGEEMPFSARKDDTEELGRFIYHNCTAGKYGPIKPYRGSR
jgi:hypothetical protein